MIASLLKGEQAFSRANKFFGLAYERQIVYILKTLGKPYPWTRDIQFNTWFFCNVFRYQDKVTQWIINNIILPSEDDPDLWKKILIARRMSRIESMQFLLDNGGFEDLDKGRRLMHFYAMSGKPVITAAFIMGIPDPSLGRNKIDYMFNLVDWYDKIGITDFLSKAKSIEETTRFLRQAPNMGGFLSYEVATDFVYSRYLRDAVDKNTWANPGPGCNRGISVIRNGNTSQRVSDSQALEDMRVLYSAWVIDITNNIDEVTERAVVRAGEENRKFVTTMMDAFHGLSMREVEHWLCEYDKHERKGKNKRTYPL